MTPPGGRERPPEGVLDQLFARLDADESGALSLDEVRAAPMPERGGPPPQ